jgi:hypothetical protein
MVVSPRRSAVVALLVSAAALASAADVTARGGTGATARSSVLVAGLQPGDLVTRGGVSAAVPARGTGVGAVATLAGGGAIGLQLRTRLDGALRVTSWRIGADQAMSAGRLAGRPPGATIQGSPPACQDNARHLTGSWWRSTVNWSFRARSTPANLTRPAAQAAVKAGASHITQAFNDCGRGDRVSATSRFLGITTVKPNISVGSACGNPDGYNVVGFGDLLGSELGLTCWWFQGTRTIEADMKLNKHDFNWTTTIVGCSNQYVVQAVATHEFGHVFGLAHVSEASHGNLTMSTAMFACDNSPSTLGLGDMLGLEARY